MSLISVLDHYVGDAIQKGGDSSFSQSLAHIQNSLLDTSQNGGDGGQGVAGIKQRLQGKKNQAIPPEHHQGGGEGGGASLLNLSSQVNALQLFPAPSSFEIQASFGRSLAVGLPSSPPPPSAPLSMIPTGTLVSFVGMVQDVSDSALLAASNSNSFFSSWAGVDGTDGDGAEAYLQSPLLNVHQCYVIPLPGCAYGMPPTTTTAATVSKVVRPRGRDDNEDSVMGRGGRRFDERDVGHLPPQGGVGRGTAESECSNDEHEEDSNDNEDDDDVLLVIGEEGEEDNQPTQQQQKRPSKSHLIPSDHNHSGDGGGGLLNLPTAPPAVNLSLGAIVTLITPPRGVEAGDSSMECHPVRPNSIVECYGIVMDATAGNDSEADDDEFLSGARYDRIPALLARRVLCVGCRVVQDVSELVSSPFAFAVPSTPNGLASTMTQVAWSAFGCRALERGIRLALRRQLFATFIPRVRGVLLSYLQRVCGGDALAAEYLLLHLCSTTDARQNANTVPVGDVPLRFLLPVKDGVSAPVRDQVASEVGCHLADRLREVTTSGASLVNVTRGVVAFKHSEDEDGCNSRRVAPKPPSLMPNKDAEGCYIASAPFQLPNGHSTVVAISAHSSEGAGGSATGALSAAVQEEAYMFVHRQCVTIDYFFNKVELWTDVRALVVQPMMEGLVDASATDRTHTSPPFRLACTVVLAPTVPSNLPAAVPASEGVPRAFANMKLGQTPSPANDAEGSNMSTASSHTTEGAFTKEMQQQQTSLTNNVWGPDESAASRLYFDVVRRCAQLDYAHIRRGLDEGEEEDGVTFDASTFSALHNELNSTLESHSVALNTELVQWQTRCRSSFNSDSLIHNNTLSVVLSLSRALARSHGRLPLGSVNFSAFEANCQNSSLLKMAAEGGGECGWVTTPQESMDDFHHIQQLEASRFQRNSQNNYTPSEGCA